jgi:lipopolysaccharide/colanic/teichoic acid biosynthesis glycosyltransferase
MSRILDIVISGIALLVLLPLICLIGFGIILTSPGPVLFSQTRVGRHRKLFRVFKFRTMVIDAESLGSSVTAGKDKRVTPIGAYLRRTKLDELPQLWNVFTGDMSFVGPRPDVPEIVDTYNSEMLRIFEIRPGITSNATLHLRREETLLDLSPVPEEVYEMIVVPFKVALAMEHVDRKSFFFDTGILLKTVWVLTGGRHWRDPVEPVLEAVKNDIYRFTIIPDWERRRAAWANWVRYRALLKNGGGAGV